MDEIRTSAEAEAQMEVIESDLNRLEELRASVDAEIYQHKAKLLELQQASRKAAHEIRIHQRNHKALDRMAWALRRRGL